MNKHRRWLLVIILIAFALRLTLLGEQSLWYDEGVTWLLSQMSLPELIQWTAADIQPPLYYLLIWSTRLLFGDSEWALRFPSAFFNTLTIPLIYTLARRLFSSACPERSRRIPQPFHLLVSLLAAILFTLSPLMVYYSQEARMYTLLVFEAALASYLLLKILHSPTPYSLLPTPYSLIYALTAVAALYTHYFAAFLLAAHLLYVILILWQRRWPKALIAQSLQMFGLIVLLFVPWLPTLLSRLGDDPSYWPGALKLHEALQKLLISFTAGETVFEQTDWWLALGYLAVFIICGLWGIVNWQISKSTNQQIPNQEIIPTTDTFHRSLFTINHSLSFLFLWLLVPITLILLLSYQSPKFNPRYAMLAYPAFILLLTAALTQLLKIHHPLRTTHYALRTTHYALRLTPHASRIILTLSLILILSTSTFSLYNWFTDPRFSKDDFQALAQFVQERQAPDETVLLSSGHMFPVWAYYYGWENWTPLPQMERLNVNRVTDLSVAGDIAKAIEGKGGVWLVSWQDEVIDPNGVVPFWLDLVGQRPIDAGDFWGVRLEHWRLVPNRIESLYESPIKQPAPNSGYNFANQVGLLGMTQLSDAEIALFWQPQQILPDDLILTLDLTDENGFDWDIETTLGRPGAYVYPPSRWPVGQTVMTRHRLAWRIGAPPGDYLAEVGLGYLEPATGNFIAWDILDEQERPQRRTAWLGPINLNQAIQPPEPARFDPQPLVDLSPLVQVNRMHLSAPSAEPGDQVRLELLWQAGPANRDNIAIAFDLVDAAGQTFPLGSYPTPSRDFNLSSWPPADLVLGQYGFNIPPDAKPGVGTIRLQINPSPHAYDEVFSIASLEILPTTRNFTPPTSVNIPITASFSGGEETGPATTGAPNLGAANPGATTLLGADCVPWNGTTCQATPGASINLTLYWQADAPFAKNYTIFTHLLDASETPVVNADHAPPKPTQGWVTGEIIADAVTLNIPPDLPPGDYLIEVGLYDAADPAFQRLPLTTGETWVILPQPLVVE